MLANIYLFGELGNGYTQYIDDYTKPLFLDFAKQVKAKTQLLIHREDNAVYYAYIRRLSNGSSSDKYIGMCYVVSGRLIKDYQGLFNIFECAITTLVTNGVILEFTDNGEIISTIDKFYKCKAEFKQIADYLQLQLDSLDTNLVVDLPTLDYSVNTKETKVYNLKDNNKGEIEKAIGVYSYVFVMKDNNYNTDSLRSYSNLLKEKKKKIASLESDNRTLLNECVRLERAQKRFKTVAWLSVILAIIMISLIMVINTSNERGRLIAKQGTEIRDLNDWIDNLEKDSIQTHNKLNDTQYNLHLANNTIVQQNESITFCQNRINVLRDDLDREVENGREKDRKISNLNYSLSIKEASIKKLENQLQSASNTKIDVSKLQVKLYEPGKGWLYSTPSSMWYISGIDKKARNFDVDIHYDGKVVKTQKMEIKR